MGRHRKPSRPAARGAAFDLDAAQDTPAKLAAVVGALVERGAQAAAVLAGTGLAVADLARPGLRSSARQMLSVCRNAVQLDASPALGVRAGRRVRIEHFGAYGYALLACASGREAIEFALRYRALAAPLVGLRFDERGGHAVWSFSDPLALDLEGPVWRFLLEFQWGVQLSLHRDLMGPELRPARLRTRWPRDRRAEGLERVLGCDVEFAQPCDELWFDARWLDRPLALAAPAGAALVRRTCDELLARQPASTPAASRVQALLLESPGRFPTLQAIAVRLGVTPRTLHRRLAAEGHSYQRLLDGLRRQLALDYLGTTRMVTEDIAAALGYNDAAALRTAFRRWTGRTPGRWRRAAR